MAKQLTNVQTILKEIIKQEFDANDSYSDISSFFEYFSASHVLKNYGLSDEEIDNGIMGSGNDGGCDSIFLFLNDELITSDQIETLTASRGSTLTFIIIQSKNELGFGEDAIMKWKTISENLLDSSNSLSNYNHRYTEDVIEQFKMFRDTFTKLIRSQIKVSFKYYYVALATEVHPNTKHQAEELTNKIKAMYPASFVSIDFITADKLLELYNTDPETSTHLELVAQPIALGRNEEYVSLVNLSKYYQFITDDKGNLRKNFFEANVRDYQGNNSVNNNISETLANDTGEDFWWLNNGVTILSEKIQLITARELELLNPEIVNGLQTSTEIYNYYTNHPDKIQDEKRNVLVRIITPSSEESRDNIIFATNNQTAIPKSSLRVTDPIHIQIELYFKTRGLYYDRRKNYYKNQKKKATEIVSVSFLAQCLISVLLRKPDYARARPSTLLTDENTYNTLYNDKNDLSVYYKCAYIGKKIQKQLKDNTILTPAERSDLLFYVVYAVFAKEMQKKEISFADLKSFNIDTISAETINDLISDIYKKYKEKGGNGRVAKSSEFIGEIDNILNLNEVIV
ncbi:MAG: AIPR family protein [Oscillospiraceae bacterium]|nr:AIPR family protein [Oscillospiraceae bacterium]